MRRCFYETYILLGLATSVVPKDPSAGRLFPGDGDTRVRESRGTGLGSRLMDELLAAPALSGVDSIELVCQPELLSSYRRWAFTDQVGRSVLVRRTVNPLLAGEQTQTSSGPI